MIPKDTSSFDYECAKCEDLQVLKYGSTLSRDFEYDNITASLESLLVLKKMCVREKREGTMMRYFVTVKDLSEERGYLKVRFVSGAFIDRSRDLANEVPFEFRFLTSLKLNDNAL